LIRSISRPPNPLLNGANICHIVERRKICGQMLKLVVLEISLK
jgi:hypothetical protein